MPRLPVRWRKPVLFATALVLTIGLLELSAALYLRLRFGSTRFVARPFHGFGQTHPTLWWALQPNVNMLLGASTIRTNSFGLRDDRNEFPDQATRIVCLGDSTTFGWNVDQREMYPARLEGLLAEQSEQPVIVVSAGVPGYTSYQSLTQYREQIAPGLRPDVVIVLSSNNECRKRSLADRERAARLAALDSGNWWFQQSSIWSLLRRRADSLEEAWNEPARSGTVANTPLDYGRNMRELVHEIRGHGAIPVIVSVPLRLRYKPTWRLFEEIGPDAQTSLMAAWRLNGPESLGEVAKLLRQATEASPKQVTAHFALGQCLDALGRREEAETSFRLAREMDLHPEAAKPSYNAVLESICRSESVLFVDGHAAFVNSGFPESELFLDHCHPTALGHRLLAAAVADALAKSDKSWLKSARPAPNS